MTNKRSSKPSAVAIFRSSVFARTGQPWSFLSEECVAGGVFVCMLVCVYMCCHLWLFSFYSLTYFVGMNEFNFK